MVDPEICNYEGSVSNKRRRTKPSRYEVEYLRNEENLMLQQALKVSKLDTKRSNLQVPEAPTFHPTIKEFMDPLKYITSIQGVAKPYGICKIVPPPEWQPPSVLDFNNAKKFATKAQQVDVLQQGQGFKNGTRYNLQAYKEMADAFYNSWSEKHYGSGKILLSQLCKDYWDMVETSNRKALVEYGNDLDTVNYASGFLKADNNRNAQFRQATAACSESYKAKDENNNGSDRNTKIKAESATVNIINACSNTDSKSGVERDHASFDSNFYVNTGWNLNNIPTARGSVLQYLQTPINGINVPWLYVGMLFASFCWHNEDNYFYSINYSHMGAVKQWYGVPGDSADQFEKVSKEFLLGLFRESPDLLHHMTTQISPSLLLTNGVPVFQITHEPKTFLVTFPKAYHAGFSTGFNVGEAVNFATADWLPSGAEAEERYRLFGRESVFSHQRLLFTLLYNKDQNLFKSQPCHDNPFARANGATNQHCIEEDDSCDEAMMANVRKEVYRIISAEIQARPVIYKQGVRDLSDTVTLPENNFSVINEEAAEFDELRCCCVCKQTCVLSAVGCECDQAKVACIRHYAVMCKCSMSKRFMLEWMSTPKLICLQTALKLQQQRKTARLPPEQNASDTMPTVPGNRTPTARNGARANSSVTAIADVHKTTESDTEDELCSIDSNTG